MTEEEPTPPNDPYAGTQHQPNWGSAYPPPGQQPPGTPPPGYGPPPGAYYPPPGQGYPPPGFGYPQYVPPPKHESATTSLVLGLVGTAGAVACYLPVFVAPFAWYIGAKTVREIDDSRGALSGRSEAKAGMILGIIGTVLLIIALAVIVVLIVLSFTVDGMWDDEYYDETSVDAVLAGLRSLLR
ncbi:DUF4190 domain-containing protein [Aeromicrobium sp. UC242_57]|uniref:DUF4190 domain-containing protein n=1 Tax=Aeromicrobium sp. UC242_57 TaxID=3374624 RepID=UPI0037AC3B22